MTNYTNNIGRNKSPVLPEVEKNGVALKFDTKYGYYSVEDNFFDDVIKPDDIKRLNSPKTIDPNADEKIPNDCLHELKM